MRVYFLSDVTAALKLNGEYAGVIGAIEKYADIDGGEEVLCEAIPQGEHLPRNFFIGRELFKNPPAFLKVYLFEGGAQIYITQFERADTGIKIVDQRQISGLNVTLLCAGGRTYASCDGAECSLHELPQGFENASLSTGGIGGLPVVLVEQKNLLCLISSNGKKLFCGETESYSLGDMLELTVNFKGCAGYCAERTYGYDGQQLIIKKSVIKKRRPTEEGVMHFAFFEGLLYGADCGEYLSGELTNCVDALHEYLGDFCEVVVPHKDFFDKYGDAVAAGLVYPLKENLFEVKYFAVELKDGKIDNVKRLP